MSNELPLPDDASNLLDELKTAMGEHAAGGMAQWARRNIEHEEATMRRLNAGSPGYEAAYHSLRRWHCIARTYELVARLQSSRRREVTTA